MLEFFLQKIKFSYWYFCLKTEEESAGARQEELMQSVVSTQINLSARRSYTAESLGFFTQCADSILFFCID